MGGYTKHNESSNPEWAGTDFVVSPITKVIFQNRIVPLKTRWWFYNFENLIEIENIDYLDTSKSTDMSYMFYKCKNLTQIDVSGFDTGNSTSFWGMFCLCSNLSEVDVSGFNTSKATIMQQMFQSCGNLKNLNLLSFNTSSVIYMMAMFVRCSSLSELDISSFDTSKVKYYDLMLEDVECAVYIGNNWTLTEAYTGYQGEFLTKS